MGVAALYAGTAGAAIAMSSARAFWHGHCHQAQVDGALATVPPASGLNVLGRAGDGAHPGWGQIPAVATQRACGGVDVAHVAAFSPPGAHRRQRCCDHDRHRRRGWRPSDIAPASEVATANRVVSGWTAGQAAAVEEVLPVHAQGAYPPGATAGTAEPAAALELGAVAVVAWTRTTRRCGCCRGTRPRMADPVEVAVADLVEPARTADNANAAEHIPLVHALCAPTSPNAIVKWVGGVNPHVSAPPAYLCAVPRPDAWSGC